MSVAVACRLSQRPSDVHASASFGGEDHRRHLFLCRVDVAQDHVEERHHDGRDRDREEHGPAAEEDPDRGHRDEHEERREPDRLAEHLRHDQVVLEQPDARARSRPRAARRGTRRGESDRDGERAGGERADHRDDLDEARERADEDPVRLADRPEEQRERGPDEHDQEHLAAHEAPSRRSISVHVSRTSLRFGRGISEQTTSTVLSRSKIQ